MRRCLLLIIALLWPSAAAADSLAHWTALGPGGAVEERIVSSNTTCPAGTTTRAQATTDFPLVCSALKKPLSPPHRILVLGDTGCRIKPPALQDCSDITKWPFPALAASAAKLKPDLVIHVGDYLYREAACPVGVAGCANTPWGDNWPTWNADYFAPAAPLLAVAPWIFVRGNHEDCARAGAGFMRLLAPIPFDPQAPCAPHLKPYVVPAGAANLVVLDDASAPDTSVAMLPDFQADFAALETIASKPSWLLMHRPVWGLVRGPLGIPVGGNLTMITAVGNRASLAPVELMLAGHIHSFEAINYDSGVPPQILAGHGGDNLDPTPLNLKGATFQGNSGVHVKDGLSVGGFGFLMMIKDQDGWDIDLHRVDGTVEGHCVFRDGRVDCPGLAPRQQ